MEAHLPFHGSILNSVSRVCGDRLFGGEGQQFPKVYSTTWANIWEIFLSDTMGLRKQRIGLVVEHAMKISKVFEHKDARPVPPLVRFEMTREKFR